MAAIKVNVDNFARAETDRTIAGLLALTGGVGAWRHDRDFAPLDEQPVIRQNRDTFYSVVVADLAEGATLTLPDAGDRYLSAMVINQDHFINEVLHDAGDHELTIDRYDTRYVVVAVRILVDPNDAADLAEVHALQDGLALRAGSNEPFVLQPYDEASHTATRQALLELATGIEGFASAFGRRSDVDPVRHLVGTAAGWGGLPQEEAFYVNVNPGLPAGEYGLRVGEVPVDAFWSISVYNAAGYFEPNEAGIYNLNSITAKRDDDGGVTVRFGGNPSTTPNALPLPEGWNYLVRLYRPRPEVLDGTWSFPSLAQG